MHCGRYIADRAISDHDWAQIKYCSGGCRGAASARIHKQIETEILRLLSARQAGATICPSEAARSLFPETFREHLEDTRRAARRLAHRKVIRITQRGKVVDPGHFKGVIRLGRGKGFPV